MSFFNVMPLSARYIILSALGFSIMGALVKLSSAEGIPVMEIVAARSLVSFILSYFDIRRKNISLLGRRKGLLLARGFAGALALVCVYFALTQLPFAEATVLQYLHPMFTTILAFLFLKERLQLSTLFCIVLSLLGLLLIVRPDFFLVLCQVGFHGLRYSQLLLVLLVVRWPMS